MPKAKATAPKAVKTQVAKINLPVRVVEGTQTSKLTDGNPNYYWYTTYALVGPTCPTTCWFHPESIHKEEAQKLGMKPCYALHGRVRLNVVPVRFAGADFGDDGLIAVRQRFEHGFLLHQHGRRVIDGIRWQTGGDVLHPETGRPWVAFIDLIVDVTRQAVSLGIPVIGFTATWREPESQKLRGIFQASVQTLEDAKLAISMGWSVAYAVMKGEVQTAVRELRALGVRAAFCPEQAGKADSCSNCGLCATLDERNMHEVPFEVRYMHYRKRFASIDVPMAIVFEIHR
jgi:hypothetical protein